MVHLDFRIFFKRCWLLLCGLSVVGWAGSAEAKVEFKHKPPKAIVGKPVTVKGVIEENEDLNKVFFFFRRKGTKPFAMKPMTLYEGDRYKVTLPGRAVILPALEYYVEGVDLQGKKVPLFASKEKPFALTILDPEDDALKDDPSDKKKESSEGTVFSAARKQQRVQNAPAVITVITESDIKAAGYRDIVELLRYVVGIDINNNGLSPDFGMRGVNPRLSFGDKIVLMIDGHNMSWRQLNRNSNLISIDMIKQIEVIRGPGSTLWGANALSGVINIITKTNSDLKGFSATLGGSPLSRSYFLTLQGGQEIVGGLTFRASFSMQRDNNSPLLAPIYEFLNSGQGGIRYVAPGNQETNQYFYSQLTWRGLSLSFYQNHYYGTLPLSSFSVVGGDETFFAGNRYITKLSWLTTLGNWGTLLVWGSHDYYGFGPESKFEANPLVRAPSASTLDGLSGYFQIFALNTQAQPPAIEFKGYYPLCNLISRASPTPCVLLVSNPRTGGQMCRLVANPASAGGQGQDFPVGRPSAQNPNACVPTYGTSRGNYTRRVDGHDHRFEAGVQLSIQPIQSLYINVGLDFEYLSMVQVYFPEIWELLQLPDTNRTNIHFSAFVQAQYNFRNFVEFTVGGRIDYDQQYGFVPTPRAAVVLTPGGGFFAKLLYGNAFKAPSFFDLYYYRPNESYGNPGLKPESVHTGELQLGWFNNKLMAVSVNGYISYFSNLIAYQERNPDQTLEGEEQFDSKVRPDKTKSYEQKANEGGFLTYGGEFELRLFPVKGLNILASFGLFFRREGERTSLPFAANWMGSIAASYRYKFVMLSVGALFVAPKEIPRKEFPNPENASVLPSADVSGSTRPGCSDNDKANGTWNCVMPSWDIQNDPSTRTPFYIQSYLTLQFLRILGHMDIVFRLSNLLNMDIYDAADDLLIPQKKLEFMAWIRLRY